MHWYKRDPAAFLAGTVELTNQECGAYSRIIDLLYSRDGLLKDDDRMMCMLLRCHGNEWRAVKKKLINKGKIWIEDGIVHANRVDSALKEAANLSETQRNRAAIRWEKYRKLNEINEPSMPSGNASIPTTTTTKKERKVHVADATKTEEFEKEIPVDEPIKARLFREGKTILVSMGVSEKQSGAVIGRWLKQNPDADGILAALVYAADHNVIEPIGYVTKLLNGGTNGGRQYGRPNLLDIGRELADEARRLERAAGIKPAIDPVRGH